MPSQKAQVGHMKREIPKQPQLFQPPEPRCERQEWRSLQIIPVPVTRWLQSYDRSQMRTSEFSHPPKLWKIILKYCFKLPSFRVVWNTAISDWNDTHFYRWENWDTECLSNLSKSKPASKWQNQDLSPGSLALESVFSANKLFCLCIKNLTYTQINFKISDFFFLYLLGITLIIPPALL